MSIGSVSGAPSSVSKRDKICGWAQIITQLHGAHIFSLIISKGILSSYIYRRLLWLAVEFLLPYICPLIKCNSWANMLVYNPKSGLGNSHSSIGTGIRPPYIGRIFNGMEFWGLINSLYLG